MRAFKVWDKINGSSEEAEIIEAHYSSSAAEEYAEEDVDGHIEGTYGNGHPIMVQTESGKLYEYKVTMEVVPSFYADLISKRDSKRLEEVVSDLKGKVQ